MRLAEWRKDQKWTQEELAAALDVSQSVVSDMERADGSIPKRNTMRRIYILTGGAVQPNDFFDLPDRLAA